MVGRQTEYYNQTALLYDQVHRGDRIIEHTRALDYSWPIVENLGVESVLDVGCGTGRSLQWVHSRAPHVQLSGVEPSSELLALAKSKLPDAELVPGNGEALALPDCSRDVVLAIGVMHHADHPRDVIREMFRVARKAVLISDHNNFAFGRTLTRWVRLWLYAMQLLAPATFVKQGFRKQGFTPGDGWWYPYSLLNDFDLIGSLSARQYVIPTRPINALEPRNFLLIQSHMVIVAVKESAS